MAGEIRQRLGCVVSCRRLLTFMAGACALATFHCTNLSAATLSLPSGSGTPGQSSSLALALSGAAGSGTSAIQFAITYSTSDFSSVSVSSGAAASAAGKSVSCRSASGSLQCLIYGTNSIALQDGTVAVVSATPLGGNSRTRALTFGTVLGATAKGVATVFTTQNGSVTTTAGSPVTGPCAAPKMLCVDDTPGSTQEYTSIQSAANAAQPGDSIVIYPGSYAGFTIARSGTAASPIAFTANGAVSIASPAANGDGVVINNAGYVRVEGLTITGMTGRCVVAQGGTASSPIRGLIMRGITCSSAQNGGFSLTHTAGAVVEGNTFSGILRSHAIAIQGAGSDGTVLRRNTIDGVTGAGNGIYIAGNTSAGGDGLVKSVLLDGNLVRNVSQSGIILDGVQDSRLENNIVYDVLGSALRAYRTSSTQGPRNLAIVNNTFHTPAGGSWVIRMSEDLGAHAIFNNVLLTDNPSVGSLSLSVLTDVQSNYNVTVSRFSRNGGTSALYLSEWRGYGLDYNSFTAAPWQIFIQAGSDYHLGSTSFAIDKGVASLGGVGAPKVDFARDARPKGSGYDIGAYESTATAPPPPPPTSTISLNNPRSGASVSGTAVAVAAVVTGSTSVSAVQFYVDDKPLVEDTSAPYSVLWNTTGISNGSHVLHAVARLSNGTQITSAKVTITVANVAPGPISTSLTVGSSASPVSVGKTVTFTASIQPAAATGTIQFRTGSMVLGTASLAAGRATVSTASLPAGVHPVQAIYSGSAGYSASTSPTFQQVITADSSNCADRRILCVDDTTGATQEYSTIQAAATAALAGDTVLVHPGRYSGFRLATSGVSNAPITFKANGAPGSVVIGSPSSGDGIFLSNVSYVVIEGFTIDRSLGSCIAARDGNALSPMSGLVIRGNTCANAANGGFYLSQVANSLIENNTIYDISRSHGIYLANAGSDNTVLRGNTIYNVLDAEAAGIHMNGDLSVGGNGLISNVVLDGNVIHDVNFNGVSMDGVQNSTLQNNLIYAVAGSAVRAFRIDGAQGPKGLRFVNNTFNATGGWAIKISEDLGGHQVFNNVLLTASTSAGSISIGVTTGFDSANNAVVNRFSRDNANSIIPLATWQSSGFDTGSFVTSAASLFISATTGDYRLATRSPAVDKGIRSFNGIASPTKDLVGASRPRGAAIDIGAFEQQ